MQKPDYDRTYRTQKGFNATEQAWINHWYGIIRYEETGQYEPDLVPPAGIISPSRLKTNGETVKIVARFKRVQDDANRIVEIWRHNEKNLKWELYAACCSDYDEGHYKFEQLKPKEKYTGPIYPEGI